ncbi:MAG: cysteine permease [Campylobacterales bacterium]|nr:cysteine permease [Campylobacterales bacterium]
MSTFNKKTIVLSDNERLDRYVLGKELMEILDLTPNAFRYWKDCVFAKYDSSSIVFIEKKTVPTKYKKYLSMCSDLSGKVQSSAFCRYTGLSPSLLVESNKSEFKGIIEIEKIGRCKLVNINKFYKQYGLPNHYVIYIDKCKNFSYMEKKIQLTKSLCMGYY